MRKFSFSLASALEVSKLEEKSASKLVVAAEAVLQGIEKELHSIDGEISEAEMAVSRQMQAGMLASSLQAAITYLKELQNRREQCRLRLVQAIQDVDHKRREVKRALQKKKVLEKLYEKKHDEWQHEIETEEMTQNDEYSTQRFARTKTKQPKSL